MIFIGRSLGEEIPFLTSQKGLLYDADGLIQEGIRIRQPEIRLFK
jgi:hypothetical protein